MTATSNARMFRVQLSDDPSDTALLSEAEIAELREAFRRKAQGIAALAPPATEELPDLPDFNASDAQILAGQKKPQSGTPAPARQSLIIGIGGAVVALLLVALSLGASAGRSAAPQALIPATAAASVAAPTAAQSTAAAPVNVPAAAPEPTVEAFFDYRDPVTSTMITTTGMLRVEGQAGDAWRLVALSAGRGSLWVRAADVPSTLAAADPLPDLARRPTPIPAAAPAAPPASPTPEPQPPCLTAGTGTQTVTVCDWLEPDQLRAAAAQKWVQTYGGNIGIVATPSPQKWSTP